MSRFSVTFILALTVIAAPGCGKKSVESKSMDAIYEESGVPVTVAAVAAGEFRPDCLFHSVLTGIRETSASAMLSDKVEKINFAVGDHVAKDQIVMIFPTDNPATQYYQVKTTFEHAGTTLARIKNLYDNGGISLQEYENTKTQYEVVKANWESVQRAVRVKAPIGGVITQITVRESDNVAPGDKLFVVADTRKLKAEVWVTENQAASVSKGAAATASWQDITIPGRVVQVDASLNAKRQAFGAVIEFDNPGGRMKAGVNAEIHVSGGRSGNAVVVDRKNIVTVGDSSFVYVARDSVAVMQPVVTGRRRGMDIEIIRGLQPGDQLITGGQMLLEDGAKIRIVER